jgi:hypothetical protein
MDMILKRVSRQAGGLEDPAPGGAVQRGAGYLAADSQ